MTSLLFLPFWYQCILAGILGAILASFINVVTYRMHTNASLGGRSRCFSCGHNLSWYELVPVFSFLFLRGRCFHCRASIATRNVLVELLMAAVFVFLYSTSASFALFLLQAGLCVVLLGVALYDLDHMIIPNELVWATAAFSVAILIVPVLFGDSVFALNTVVLHLGAGAAAFIGYGSLWLVSRGQWIGLGDAKLALPLGLLLLPGAALSMIVLSFWIGATIALLLLAAQLVRTWYRQRSYTRGVVANTTQYFTMKSEIPFAPFLILSFFVTYFLQGNVLTIVSYVFPL